MFQLHSLAADGTVQFRKAMSRPQFQRIMAEHPQCLVLTEARGATHPWAREPERAGHARKLIVPRHVKPCIKQQENDAADTEAIEQAALRPTMRHVEPKTGDQQARSILYRTRELFEKQRTEAVAALRSHRYEVDFTAPEGTSVLPRPAAILEDPNSDLPPPAREICRELVNQIVHLTGRINAMNRRIDAIAREGETSRRLQTTPGLGPISALAVETLAPPMEQFKRGCDFAAWLGLVPRSGARAGQLAERLEATERPNDVLFQLLERRLAALVIATSWIGGCATGGLIVACGPSACPSKSKALRSWRGRQMIGTLNTMFREPRVDTRRGGPAGGGAVLTKAGRRVRALDRTFEGDAAEAGAPRLEAMHAPLRDIPEEK